MQPCRHREKPDSPLRLIKSGSHNELLCDTIRNMSPLSRAPEHNNITSCDACYAGAATKGKQRRSTQIAGGCLTLCPKSETRFVIRLLVWRGREDMRILARQQDALSCCACFRVGPEEYPEHSAVKQFPSAHARNFILYSQLHCS